MKLVLRLSWIRFVLLMKHGGMKLKYYTRKYETDGTITVFLSLILLIILSLIFTIIEGARVYTARVMAERALTTAMDSVLAEYYGPLWEEYHIFGRHCEGDSIVAQQEIQDKMGEYIGYTIEPEVALKNSYTSTCTELYHLSMKDISVSEETSLLDYEGKLLINEAIEYMKYQEMGDTAEVLLNKLKLLQTPNHVSYLMEEKQELQDELVQIDKGVLKLMMLFDGIETSDKGIKLTKQGTLKINNYFIKRICNKEVTMQQVGINQKDVFTALKEHYINPGNYFSQIESCFAVIEDDKSAIQTAREQIAAESAAISATSMSLGAQSSEIGDEDQAEKQKDEIRKQLQALQESIQRKEAMIAAKEKEIKDYENKIKTISKALMSIIQNTKPLITEAITCINNLQLKVKIAAPLVANYEKLITQEKKNLEDSTYAGLEEGLEELKKYVGTGNLSYNFDEMKQILEKNRIALEQAESKLTEGEQRLLAGDHQNAALYLKGAEENMNTYQINGLTLDYSTLVLDKSNQNSLLDKVEELVGSGFVSLVIDTDSVSKVSLNSSHTLPSELANLTQDSSDPISTLKNFFQSTAKETSNSNTENLFQSFSDETSVNSVLGVGINKIAENYLFEEYLKEHFYNYQGQISEQDQVTDGIQNELEESTKSINSKEDVKSKESGNSNLKPSVLKYEQEYLIAGKASDQENLYTVIMKIIFIRTILDFITVLSDSTAREEARAAAIAIVGFTGLPILIGAVQVMIMIAWALEEALLDTCALMNGKEVPLVKRKTALQFNELFLINRTYLEKKVQGLSATNEISLSYQQYLQLFLMMNNEVSLSYRSMDLMQENIRCRYEVDTFEMEDCYFGFQAEAEFGIMPIFTKFSFVQNYISGEKDDYSFKESAEYSY